MTNRLARKLGVALGVAALTWVGTTGAATRVPQRWIDTCEAAATPGVETTAFESYAEILAGPSWVKGLPNWFCAFESATSFGMVDLATLASKRPSIAATYLLRGIKYCDMPDPPKKYDNPGTWFCRLLQGTSITRYSAGGFVSDGGENEICVFGDGSMTGIWELIYLSISDPGPDYLGIRAAIQSDPLALALPYLGDGTPTPVPCEQ